MTDSVGHGAKACHGFIALLGVDVRLENVARYACHMPNPSGLFQALALGTGGRERREYFRRFLKADLVAAAQQCHPGQMVIRHANCYPLRQCVLHAGLQRLRGARNYHDNWAN